MPIPAPPPPCRWRPSCAVASCQGEFKPGARLKIDEIAELCAVSHMPVRVALQSLESEGVLDIYPRRGAVIKAVDARFVRNMLEVRGAMEVMLSVRCAQLVDKAGLEEIEGLVAEYEEAARRNRPLAIVSANLRLHDAIHRWADNPEALRVLARGRLLIQALRARYGFGPGRVEQAVAEHRQLLRAIARRDARRAGEIAGRHCEARATSCSRCCLPAVELKRETSGRPAKNAARLSTTNCPSASRVCCVPLAACGLSTTLSSASSARRYVRLVGVHVEARAGQASVHERVDEVRLVDDRAARDVDEVARAARARRSPSRLDEAARFRAARHRDHQHLHVARELARGRRRSGRARPACQCRP